MAAPPSPTRIGDGVIRLTTGEGSATADVEEARQRYRACLFAYLPRVGSDLAAELLRDACAEEFLGGQSPRDGRPSRPPASRP